MKAQNSEVWIAIFILIFNSPGCRSWVVSWNPLQFMCSLLNVFCVFCYFASNYVTWLSAYIFTFSFTHQVCQMGKFHNILYIALKVTWIWEMKDSFTICSLLSKFFHFLLFNQFPVVSLKSFRWNFQLWGNFRTPFFGGNFWIECSVFPLWLA